jgi:tetratricopeptide (TPR) repeat protein
MHVSKIVLGVGACLALLSGYKIISNICSYLDVDKKIEKNIAVAGATTTAGKKEGVLSMEELLEEALENSKQWNGQNSAIFFKSQMYSMDNLQDILKTAIQHAHEIGMLDDAYKTNELSADAPEWVKLSFENCQPDDNASLKYRRLFSSELGGTVDASYEAFNDAVAGGAVPEDRQVKQTNMALVDLMERAADRSWWSPIDVDVTPMNNAWAHTYFSLIYSDMGKLGKAVEELKKAQGILYKYPDSTELTIVRSDLKTLTIGYLKKSIQSAISEFEGLDKMPAELKYTRGWWGQVQKKSESLGADNVFIGNMADHYGGRYGCAAGLWFLPLALGIAIAAGGYFLDDTRYGKPKRGRYW